MQPGAAARHRGASIGRRAATVYGGNLPAACDESQADRPTEPIFRSTKQAWFPLYRLETQGRHSQPGSATDRIVSECVFEPPYGPHTPG